MKLEMYDGLSTNSDYSNDSQISQMSNSDNITSLESGPTSIPRTFISLDGLSSGVPTQTTPTLTPTTLRNIEQTFIELQSSEIEQRDQAGFVPPVVIGNNQYVASALSSSDTELSNKSMWGNSDSSGGSIQMRPSTPVTPHDSSNSQPTPRRSTGGRRPNNRANVSPEEEQRRNVRRERNKMAAARCRKRRMDHTNALIEETEGLEQKKQALQSEIQQLQDQRDELQFILETHRAVCRIQNSVPGGNSRPVSPMDIKPLIFPLLEPSPSENIRVKAEMEGLPPVSMSNSLLSDDGLMFTHPAKKPMLSNNTSTLSALNTPVSKPNRPNSLIVPGANAFIPKTSGSSVEIIAGVPITTPSAGIPFNFDSLMEGGTGLTPVSGPLVPSCSSQQRNGLTNTNAAGDLITPDTSCPSKLVSL